MSDQPVPSVPPATTQSLDEILNQLEKTTGTSPTPTPAPTPEPASIPAMPPVATIPENPVTPVTPAPIVNEPAPMVHEEPTLNPEPIVTPAPAPTPEPTPTSRPAPMPEVAPTAPAGEPSKKSNSMNKVIVGVVGVLLLLGVAGIGVYATRMQQNTQTTAYLPATPLPTEQPVIQPSIAPAATVTPAPTPIPTLAPGMTVNDVKIIAGTISGKICRDTVKKSGSVLFYNLARNTVQFIPVTATSTTYTRSLIPGNYNVLFQDDKGTSVLGYTDASHNSKLVSVGVRASIKNIDLCDANSTLPSGQFTSETISF